MRLKYKIINEILTLYPHYQNLDKYTYMQLKIIKLCCKYHIPTIYHDDILKLKNEMLMNELAIKIENLEVKD